VLFSLAMKPCLSIVETLVVFSLMSCTARTTVFTTPNSAMDPTILEGEKFTAEMHPFQPSRGDLVIFRHERILIVKRVIGTGGDVVEGHDSQVFLNGKALRESYIQHSGKAVEPLNKFGPMKVSDGQLFVMGDNRDYSLDSRDSGFGLVSVSDVIEVRSDQPLWLAL